MTKVFFLRNAVKSAVAVLAVTMMTACGGGSSNKGTAQQSGEALVREAVKEATEQTEFTESNWQSQMKKAYGIDIAIPKGWKFNTVRYYNSLKSLAVTFTKIDNAVQEKEAFKPVFEATKAISPDGNYATDVSNESTDGIVGTGKKYETADDLYAEQGTKQTQYSDLTWQNLLWFYTFNGKRISASYATEDGKMTLNLIQIN